MSTFQKLIRSFTDLSPPLLGYIVLVTFSSGALAAALVLAGQGLGNPAGVIALAVVAAICERGRIVLGGDFGVSISLLPATYAAVLFGPLAGMVVFGASVIGLSMPLPGRMAYFGNRTLTGAAAAGSAAAVVTVMPSAGIGQVVAASAAAALVAEVLDAALASVVFSLRGKATFRQAFSELIPVIVASVPIYSPAVAVLVLAYREVSPWTLPLFFIPALAAQRWFLLYQEQRRLATDLGSLNEQLRAANLSFAKGLIATLDARDRYTAGHSAAVAVYARDIATRMALSEGQQALAHLCGSGS